MPRSIFFHVDASPAFLDGLPADGQAQAQTAIATAFGAVLRKEAVQDTERIELSILSNMTVGNRRF